ncbi:vacuolar protein-sorting-associated protein 36-like [Anneissia japonica]|uniref:vacuolar protein-sorting-associated protein 36-like n=1 Tax=Anneissia japonica TaxID=1529436 RepID=UPI0014256020|nr:vacuolar protein-sorting-associated protein 36-like [Anneissia japonica]
MDRFEWSKGTLIPGEVTVTQQSGVKIYDGSEKTPFERGMLVLSSHHIFWRDPQRQSCIIALPLSLVLFAEEVSEGRGRSQKIVLHLLPPQPGKPVGPSMSSAHSNIRFGFKEAGETEFFRCLSEELRRKRWEHAQPATVAVKPKEIRAGIVGIERRIEEKRKETDSTISKAFEDLNKLMDKAKEMVNLSKTISNKIKERQGSITENETIQFKSYLLSLGISNPVTRETHGSGSNYHIELAKQLSEFLKQPIEESGGMMALTDVYCRINRARGMELLSPDDLVDACKQFDYLKCPLSWSSMNLSLLMNYQSLSAYPYH